MHGGDAVTREYYETSAFRVEVKPGGYVVLSLCSPTMGLGTWMVTFASIEKATKFAREIDEDAACTDDGWRACWRNDPRGAYLEFSYGQVVPGGTASVYVHVPVRAARMLVESLRF